MRPVWKSLIALVLTAGAGGGGYYWYVNRAPEEAKQPQRPPPTVVLAPAGTETITRTIEAVGNTRAIESVTLTAKAAGRIETLRFTDGDQVDKGELLVQLEQPEVKAELAAVEAEAQEIEQQLARQEELLTRGASPRALVDDSRRRLQAARARIAAARKRFEDTAIRAPFAGRLGLRDVSVGALIEPGTALATLDSISPMDLRFTVPEQYLGQIGPGAKVTGRTSAFSDRTFEGEVRAIDSRIDPALRTLAVEARVPNPEGMLRPGMLMNVQLALATAKDAVIVPPLAVLVRGDEHFVYRVADGKAQRVKVEIGQREPDRLEITQGLKAGEAIVVEGMQELNDGQPVQVKEPGQPGGDGREVAARRQETPPR